MPYSTVDRAICKELTSPSSVEAGFVNRGHQTEIFWVKIGTGFRQRISALSLATVLDIVNRGLDRSRHGRKKSVRRELLRRISLFCVTAFAVNRFTFLRLKRDFTFLSAFCTGSFEHLAWSKIFPWAPFAKVFHVFSPNRHNKRVFRTLIQGGNYNQTASHYQEDLLK
jgi:hypothetical protein